VGPKRCPHSFGLQSSTGGREIIDRGIHVSEVTGCGRVPGWPTKPVKEGKQHFTRFKIMTVGQTVKRLGQGNLARQGLNSVTKERGWLNQKPTGTTGEQGQGRGFFVTLVKKVVDFWDRFGNKKKGMGRHFSHLREGTWSLSDLRGNEKGYRDLS